ncbi:MbnP family protein [Flammeovirga sp. OC4]|uniref:MbnP family protein n=1 Tax=Flammeovirga sp. OC4 TaxID=1382345 RepID=UPI0005C47ACC|nr:MbnP family protein [Flammeovirga sp. OC4]
MKQIFLLLLFSCFLIGCDSHKETFDAAGTGELTIKFNLIHDDTSLTYNKEYINALSQSYTISDFRFYLSNVVLRDTSATNYYKIPESYHLIEMIDQADTSIVLTGLPNRAFSELEFSVGVDNSANYSTDQIGDLDPANGMAWNWDTGYKFMLVEGLRLIDDTNSKGLVYHIGGDANYRTVKFSGKEIFLNQNSKQEIVLDVHVDFIFGDKKEALVPEGQRKTNFIDFNNDTDQDTMFGPNTQLIADNYAQMFEWKDIFSK